MTAVKQELIQLLGARATEKIVDIAPANFHQGLADQWAQVWEDSVRVSHDFLTEADIKQIGEDVRFGVKYYPQHIMYVENQQPVAIMTVNADKIEMLFVRSDYFGQGIGKKLVNYAITTYHITKVDVNEQNPAALGFYQHLGFQQIGRSDTDDQGRPFPILHLQL